MARTRAARARPTTRTQRAPLTLAEVERWLASRPPLRAARGRPRQGEEPILPALMARFGVSRSTAKRVLERLRRARVKANAAVPVDHAQARLLAALAGRYRKSSSELQKKGSSSGGASQVSDRQVVAATAQDEAALPDALSMDAVRAQLTTILAHWPAQDALWERLPQRVATRATPSAAAPAAPSAQATTGPGVRTSGNSDQVIGIGAAALIAREALIEALEAYGASDIESPAVVRAMQSLLRYLRERQARERPAQPQVRSASGEGAGGAAQV